MQNFKTLRVILALGVVTVSLVGCSGNANPSVTATASASASPSATESPSTGASAANTSEFSYSDGIDENGLWAGITALDYVDLCEYTSISIPREEYAVSEADIDSQVDSIVSSYSTQEQVTNRAVKDGDTVNIDYVGSIDGVAFDSGSTNGEGTDITIGTTQYIDDFLEQLIGHKPGETFDVNVTFPADYGVEDLNGKDAVFKTTINYITETTAPELTDAFVAENLKLEYDWSTIDEMRKSISEDLKNSAIQSYLDEYMAANSTVKSLPDALMTYQENSLVSYYQDMADSYGVGLEEFITSYLSMSSVEDLLASYQEENTQYANDCLIVQAVAEDAGLTVSDEDVTNFFSEHVEGGDPAEYTEYYGMPYIKQTVLRQMVTDYLADRAVLQ